MSELQRLLKCCLRSEPITGIEAVQYGLANHAYSDEELLPKAKELAEKIAKKSPARIESSD